MSAADRTQTIRVLDMRGVAVGAMRDLNTIVIEDIDWVVEPGDFWVVGGVQGSGKSDFLLLSGGLMAPAAGVYYFMQEEMPIFEEERLRERLRLGLVFDGGQLINHLTISENIALPIRYHQNLNTAAADADVKRMLELTELSPWADSTPGAIGRNWQKRAGLARALMLKPEVLLLDNPLAGLDLRHRAWWLNLLGQLSAGHPWMDGRPMTLIVTADDLQPWQSRAQQFAFISEKRFSVLGSWAKVEAATNDQVRELLAFPAHTP